MTDSAEHGAIQFAMHREVEKLRDVEVRGRLRLTLLEWRWGKAGMSYKSFSVQVR